ncbi:response regulator [Roseivirga sp. E12]|uniref:response regulator n=1 Tax=Roseivirga sp. E12 TaxID=2819237 RepID=UPI001ABCE88A|nr:response regulator [Roseivirga sp. E12]MBO3698128.1 response regulator [Roseivirga sp. E12]
MSLFDKPAKILIADDDPLNLEVMLDFLDADQLDVLYAPHGQKAVEIAINETPDLIILDWEMPIMNGIETIKVLAQNKQTKHIPIIIATGVMRESIDLKTALDAGAIDFLKKPFDKIEFKARVDSALRLSFSRKEVRKQHSEILELTGREKELLKENLDLKSRELSSATLIDYQKNQLLIELVDKVKHIDKLTQYAYSKDIRQITRQIDGYINLGKSWAGFQLHFNQVHPNFFDKLNENWSLTNNESRICAYIKIGLENKEIAALTNVESASVRRALSRLKRKLGLKQEDNLREFINNIG